MKRKHKIVAGLIVAGTLTGMAYAQGGPGARMGGCDGMGPMGNGPMAGQGGPMGRHASMKFDPAQRAERHLGFLKSQLKLTPQQEPLWTAYEGKMKEEAGKGFQAMRAQSADEKLTAPERMAKMQKLMQERLTAMSAVHESFGRLYAALTPEQKATADQFVARMGQRGGRMGPGRMMPPQTAPQG